MGVMDVIVSSGSTMMAGGLEPLCLGKFTENLKMEKQRTGAPYPKIIRMFVSRGVPGIMAGAVPWGVLLGSSKGLFFGLGKATGEAVLPPWISGKKRAVALGAFAGAFQGVGIAPFLLASTRVNQAIAQGNQAATSLGYSFTILGDVIRKEGVQVLTRGMGTNAFKRALDWVVRFYIRETLVEPIKARKSKGLKAGQKVQLSDWDKLWTSLAAGGISVYVSTPLDRLLPLLQQRDSSKDTVTLLKEQFKGGLPKLYAGAVARSAHAALHVCFLMFVGDKIKALFKENNNNKKKKKKKNKKNKNVVNGT
eukprot:CAMPEP_0170199012 /NCGR_PEP_ID=MMETSP0040_2-20121228/69103_1 /TAXON_ID=641309 /ORGANISM="Lotharella oceanica, Strain CCMP622" /LENGTH=307 /DNA_ID=CAMNT_0010449091 /DNA_START=330 /DNA_END=1254 /DNA_ORIENTATION=-